MAYDAALPFRKDSTDGFGMVDTLVDAVHQDLKILLLTAPGERTMDPLFGVGLKRFLFQNLTTVTLGQIESKIQQQVGKYLPFITIVNIEFSSALDSAGTFIPDLDQNLLGITVSYSFGYSDVREIYVTS